MRKLLFKILDLISEYKHKRALKRYPKEYYVDGKLRSRIDQIP